MVKTKRRRRRRRRRILKILLCVIAALAVALLIAVNVFTVETVEVEGNEVYSDEKIEEWILNDEYSWNSLYVFFKYRFVSADELPFVDSIEVTLTSPHTVHLEVTEKSILGCVYISSLGQNAYIDKDGFVVELSTDVLDDTMRILGLSVETATLYEELPMEDDSVLQTLLTVSQLLDKYELEPESIYVTEDDEVILNYGDIQVNVGGNVYLNEKILRLQQILPQIEGMTGTLHLEDWSEDNTDVYFSKEELIDIPDDVQTTPSSEETE